MKLSKEELIAKYNMKPYEWDRMKNSYGDHRSQIRRAEVREQKHNLTKKNRENSKRLCLDNDESLLNKIEPSVDIKAYQYPTDHKRQKEIHPRKTQKEINETFN